LGHESGRDVRAVARQPEPSESRRYAPAEARRRPGLSEIRLGMGGRLRLISSGGAPLSKELAEFFWAVGIPIYQGYGLTETSPIVSSNYPQNRMGSSGKPIPNVQVRTAEDGEILVKGPCIMQGYYKNPEATREVLSEDGWFRTGDIGHVDKTTISSSPTARKT